MAHIWVRSEDSGPSSGILIVGEVVDLREANVCVDDLCEMRNTSDVRVDTLPGILQRDWTLWQ